MTTVPMKRLAAWAWHKWEDHERRAYEEWQRNAPRRERERQRQEQFNAILVLIVIAAVAAFAVVGIAGLLIIGWRALLGS